MRPERYYSSNIQEPLSIGRIDGDKSATHVTNVDNERCLAITLENGFVIKYDIN